MGLHRPVLWTALLLVGFAELIAAESPIGFTELPLEAPAVEIELDNADVEVLSDPTAAPVLRATIAGPDPREARLEHAVNAGILEIRRPADADAAPGRLKVEIVAGAEQEVSLGGRNLSVVTRELQRPGVTAPPGLRLVLESSELDMEGGRGAVVEARETSIWLSRTRGLLDLTLESGTAAVRGHQGGLKLDAAGAEVTVIDLQGRLEPDVDGGSLDVRGGAGSFSGKATDAVLLFDGWSGGLSLVAAGTTVEVRDKVDPNPWKLQGEGLQVTLERFAAPVTAELRGGRFAATTLGGTVVLTGTDSADVELTDLAEGADLRLSGGATARLTGISKTLQAAVEDARLDAGEVERLILTGARSEISVSGVGRVGQLEVSDSELDLDLTGVAQLSPLRLLGTGSARVRLTSPCRVRPDRPGGRAGDRIDVSGCELSLPGQPAASTHGRLIYGDRRPVILQVTLGEGVDLEVEGEP